MYESTQYNTFFRVFESVEDLIETVKSLPKDPSVRPLNRSEFIGRQFSTLAEVYQAARSAWPEGVEIIEGMVKELEDADLPKPTSRKRKVRFSEDDGAELDNDRLRSGQAFWRTTRRENSRGPQVVTIIIDVNANGDVAHRDIMWRGAAAIAMTKVLEEAGFRVELWTVHAAQKVYTGAGAGHFHAVCLKRPGDPLDIATFSAAVSGWFYRTVMWLAKSRCDQNIKSGLGLAVCPMSYQIRHALPNLRGKPIVISGAYTRASAVYVAREALKKLAGVEPPPPPPPPAESPAAVAVPAEPPRKKTKAEIAKENREYKAWLKRWEAQQREEK
jgi:hypothetical protein